MTPHQWFLIGLTCLLFGIFGLCWLLYTRGENK